MDDRLTSNKWLRCTAFEELMLAQDSEQYPCAICLRLEFSRAIDRATFEMALAELVAHHPMLQARLVRRWFKLWWQITCDSLPRINWHNEAAPLWPHLARMNLTHDVGLCLDVYPGPTDSGIAQIVFLQIHHALADGLGCLCVVEDLIKLVADRASVQCDTSLDTMISNSLNAGAISYGDVDQRVRRLRSRNRFGLTFSKLVRLLPGQMVGLLGVRQFLMRHPVAIGSPEPAVVAGHSTDQEFVAACSLELEPGLSEQLKRQAKSKQVTLNDLLATAVFEAVYQLHSENGGSEDQWLRMMVPISLRNSQADRDLSACNVVSCVFLDRTGSQTGHRHSLLQSIHEEMALIKRHRLALMFSFSIWIKKLLTVRLRNKDGRLRSGPKRCQTSFVFSNMAKILDHDPNTKNGGYLSVNDLTLVRCQILAPISRLMSVAVTAVQYAGRVTIALRYDWRCVSQEQAARFLNSLKSRLESGLLQEAAQ